MTRFSDFVTIFCTNSTKFSDKNDKSGSSYLPVVSEGVAVAEGAYPDCCTYAAAAVTVVGTVAGGKRYYQM